MCVLIIFCSAVTFCDIIYSSEYVLHCKQIIMEVVEKPLFVPPRKRGTKSSLKSSNESLHMLGTVAAHSSSPHSCPKLDHLANHKLFYQSQLSKEQDSIKMSNYHTPKSNSPILRSLACQSQFTKGCVCRSEESDLNSDTSDCDVQVNDSGYTDVDLSNERSALNSRSISSIGSCGAGSFVTMTGTVKRGRKKGQTMDMKVQMSREELDELEHSILSQQIEDDDSCFFSTRKGPHVLTLSLIIFPFVLLLSAGYSFYMGTMTWYNILIYFSEKKTVLHKIIISPLLIILYPFLISLSTIGLGAYAAAIQISWHYDSWHREVQDWEKGFYGWLCGVADLEDCSPYEVVILTDVLPQIDEGKQLKKPLEDTAL